MNKEMKQEFINLIISLGIPEYNMRRWLENSTLKEREELRNIIIQKTPNDHLGGKSSKETYEFPTGC